MNMGKFEKMNLTKVCSVAIAVFSTLYYFWRKLFHESIPNLVQKSDEVDSKLFDYIVVGAGTAGSVVASTLSEKSNYTVLLIEAGHTFNWLTSSVPIFATLIQKSQNDWNLLTVPQKYSSRAIYDERQCLPRGKGLGGSSQMNFMLHFAGYKKDFDSWHAIGLREWNFETIQQYFDSTYNSSLSQSSVDQGHSRLDIWKMTKNYSKLTETIDKARRELNDANLEFHFTQYTLKNGLRSNVFQKYLRPSFQYENLKILTNALVEKVTFDEHKQATGVIVRIKDGENVKTLRVLAKNEIVLSAGAYLTPGILQRSGIGPKNLLKKFGISMVHESPNVGNNLHDHMTFPLFVSVEEEATATIDKILSLQEAWKYATTGEGYFSSFGVVSTINSLNDSFGINIFGTGSADERFLMTISNYKRESFRSVFPLYHNTSQEGFVVLVTCYQVRSRGTVKINSTDPFDPPLINPNYLKEKCDVDCTVRAVRAAVKIIESKAMQVLRPKIHWAKNEECIKFGPTQDDFVTNHPSDEYLECLMREVSLNSHHPAGSCSMSSEDEKNQPLDEHLRVKGVSGLRVVDASVLPTPISGTPNSLLIAIANRAAHLMLR